MGTFTFLLALPDAPERSRSPTTSAQIANFGAHRQQRTSYDRYDATVPESVLGRVLFGFEDDAERPWIAYDPAAVDVVHREVARAILTAARAKDKDPYAEWFELQLRAVDRVLTHALANREWVVAVFEGDYSCFVQGGVWSQKADPPLFDPKCTLPRPDESRILPLGVGAVLFAGLAIVGFRYRRFRARRGTGS